MVKNLHWGSANIQAAPQVDSVAGLYDDGQTWPEAEPYVHDEVPAEAYVHIEPAHRRASAKTNAPIAPAAPIVQAPAPINYNFVPVGPVAQVAPVANRWGCYNWKGEGVQCRF